MNVDLTDAIGGEEITKEMGTYVEEVVTTATYVNKLVKPSSDSQVCT